jgi:hypothetical protein
MQNEAIQYFKEKGFTDLAYRGGDQSVCYSNLENGLSVIIDPAGEHLQLKVIDRMVQCSVGPFGFPNKHIPEFIRQLEAHAAIRPPDLDLDRNSPAVSNPAL